MDFYTVLALALVASPLVVHAAKAGVTNNACVKIDDCLEPVDQKYETLRFLMPKASEFDELCTTVRPNLEQCLQGVVLEDCSKESMRYWVELSNLVFYLVCSTDSQVNPPVLKLSACATDDGTRIQLSNAVRSSCQSKYWNYRNRVKSSATDEDRNDYARDILECVETASTGICGSDYSVFYDNIFTMGARSNNSWKNWNFAYQVYGNTTSPAAIKAALAMG